MENDLTITEETNFGTLLNRTTTASSKPPDDWKGGDRTAKRTKTQESGHDTMVMDMEIVDPTAEDNHSVNVQPGPGTDVSNNLSYAHALLGRENAQRQVEIENKGYEEISDDESADVEEEDDCTCPVVTLTKEEKRRLRKPWKHMLIVKVWGRQVGYAHLLRRIMMLWKQKTKLELIAMENNYFLAKLHSIDDYEYALFGGPWMIMDHYLLVRDWTPYFDPWKASEEEKIAVWVRFPDLPIEFYDYEFLMRLGEKIGEPKNIDEETSLVSRGKFARMCVEIDITKPLISKFKLRKKVRRIEYEGMHLVCFNCGVYGHTTDQCKRESKDEGTVHDTGMNTTAGGMETATSRTLEEKIRPEVVDDYGPWMLAKKPTRRTTPRGGNREQGGPRTKATRSRFEILDHNRRENIGNNEVPPPMTMNIEQQNPEADARTRMRIEGACDEIDKQIRRFLWGTTTTQRKCHLVTWGTIIKPKDEGGLGIRSTRKMNTAFLAKLAWRLFTQKESLWAQALGGKYMKGRFHFDNFHARPRQSNVWRGMFSAKQLVTAGCRRLINNGRDTRFWKDVWLCDTPLVDMVTDGLDAYDMDARFSDMWEEGRGWKWERIPPCITHTVAEKLEL